MKKIVIRKYHPRDEKNLRKLCCDTAYFGDPCESFFSDRELLADLLTKYYTDYESEHLWVAERDSELIGYIMGCFDHRKYSRIMTLRIMPGSLFRAFFRKKLWCRKTWDLMVSNLKVFLFREAKLPRIDRKKFPVHIHQNVKNDFRSKGVGSKLFMILWNKAKEEKCSGMGFRALRQDPYFLFFKKHRFNQVECKRTKSLERWLGKSPLYYMYLNKEIS